MSTVGAYEAKTHLPALLDRVAAGEQITVTKHGRPIARLVPVEPATAPSSETVAALLETRRGTHLGGSLRELIEEGRA